MTEEYKCNDKIYTIEIKDLNVGSVGAEPWWSVKVKDVHNKILINAKLEDILADYIQKTFGTDRQTFLIDFAKQEIEKLNTK